jgi:hypothetical protein
MIDGVAIPFAGAELMLRLKQSMREKDGWDRGFLQQLLKTRGEGRPGK